MRGKVFVLSHVDVHKRITPAYAGKSLLNTDNTTAARDHPRVCGEKPPSCPEMSTNEGSPPRMRGKVLKLQNALKKFRITPAYAGKRPRTLLAGSSSRDHPPRMRGKAGRALEGACIPGITPAYAGKSMMLHHSIPDTAAHDGRQVLRGLRRHLKCDWDGHLRLVQVGNVVHERALMPDVHESQSRRTPQRHNDRMGQPVQAGMHGGSHGCRGRAAAPKCPAHHPWLLPPCRMVIKPRP